MAYVTLNTRLVQKTDTAANWATNNPVLLKGEIGIAIDTGVMKIGDGTTAWSELADFGAFTAELKKKLDGIAEGAEVNQNAFSQVVVGEATVDADAKTDSVELKAAGFATVTVDETGAIVVGTNKTTLDETYAAKGTEDVAAAAVKRAGDTMTGYLTLHAAPTEEMHAANKAYVDSIVSANDAMVFKGVVDSTTGLPTEGYEVGWTYKVVEAGTYAGQACEIGDAIIVTKDYVAGEASDADFTVIQTNIDGAVTTAATAGTVASDEIVVFDGTSGKVIKSSGLTIKTSVPENAVFTDTTYEVATADVAGLVKSSAEMDKIAVAEDGVMSVNKVNVNKLAVAEGDVLILDGGSSSTVL